jgi:predicted transcriptional regulator
MVEGSTNEQNILLEWATDIIVAYAGNNMISAADLVELVHGVHGALQARAMALPVSADEPARKHVWPRASITPDYLVCLEDGQHVKSLKRHLNVVHNMTPAQYRAKWGLPPDYPMVAANFALARSNWAKSVRFGQRHNTAKTNAGARAVSRRSG